MDGINGGSELYLNKKNSASLKSDAGNPFDHSMVKVKVSGDLKKAPPIAGRFQVRSPRVQFALKTSNAAKSATTPLVVDTALSGDWRVAPLLITGPCFPRDDLVKGGGVILISCDPSSKVEGKAWELVPLNDDPATLNKLIGGFITGRAGFYPENGERRFYIELYAWPIDPSICGG